MNKFAYMIAIGFLTVAVSFSETQHNVEIRYLNSAEYGSVKSDLIEHGVLDNGVEFINDAFVLERAITVTVGAEDGPLYDPAGSEIQIPYSFYTEVLARFGQIEKDPDQRAVYASDAMLHTHVS